LKPAQNILLDNHNTMVYHNPMITLLYLSLIIFGIYNFVRSQRKPSRGITRSSKPKIVEYVGKGRITHWKVRRPIKISQNGKFDHFVYKLAGE
jgi:hypothetical protein